MVDSNPELEELELGSESDFPTLPSLVTIREQDYFLTKGNDGSYRLLSTRCPHRWGEIIEWDNCFMCPDHGWRFEKSEGICVNGPNSRMESAQVVAKDDRLFAQILIEEVQQ